jgi:WD40 repeat protein
VVWIVEKSVCSVEQITRFHFLSGPKRFYKQRQVGGSYASTGRLATRGQVVRTFENEINLRLQVDGSKLAAGLADGTVVVWFEDGAKSFESEQHSYYINSISWNRVEEKSHLFVTGSAEVNNLQIE